MNARSAPGLTLWTTAVKGAWKEMEMLTDSDRGAVDRAARNEYLIDIDETWEACREAVEGARTSYEEELELGRLHQRSSPSSSSLRAMMLRWISALPP